MKTQNKCIIYRVPLYELDRVRAGVPIEELDLLSPPREFIATEDTTYRLGMSRKGKKGGKKNAN